MDNQTVSPEPETKNVEAYQAILAINEQEQRLKANEGYGKSYLLSIVIPPIGIYYFFKYFFFSDGGSESRKAAIINLILTVVSLGLNIWLIGMFFTQPIPGGSQNLDMIKELITPENQKALQELLR